MTATNPNLREELNNGPGSFRLADVDREICWGDLLGLLISEMADTETALDPDTAAPNPITLAAAPSCILTVTAIAGAGTLGTLTLIINSDPDFAVPPTSCAWDGPGSTTLRFNAADAYTDVDIKYTVSGALVSVLERTLGKNENDR
jgi:hypothetical protein